MYGIYIYAFHVQPQLRGIVATSGFATGKNPTQPEPPSFTCTSIANDLNITNLLGGKIGVLGAGTKKHPSGTLDDPVWFVDRIKWLDRIGGLYFAPQGIPHL